MSVFSDTNEKARSIGHGLVSMGIEGHGVDAEGTGKLGEIILDAVGVIEALQERVAILETERTIAKVSP